MTVWAWGCNEYGQLADGTTTTSYTPIQVTALNNPAAISAGKDFAVALKEDGTVWAWGLNYNGQIGDGTSDDRSTPTQVSVLSGVYGVGCGYRHSLAVKNDGFVYAWGCNSSGELGVTPRFDKYSPVKSQNVYLRTPPINPIGLTATAANTQVMLNWKTAPGADSYIIKRTEVSGGPYVTITANVNDTTYTDTTVTSGITYYYTMTAVNAGGESLPSSEVSATPL